MPRKAIYWRNPDSHRAECRRRVNYLIALGIRYADQLSPAAQEVRRLANSKWCREHRAANRKAQLKYRRKLQRLFGRCTDKAIWLHTQLRAQEHAKKRKAAIALLPRKLVEDRQRMHLVSRRQLYALKVGAWYFLDETQNFQGPYNSREAAASALAIYYEHL